MGSRALPLLLVGAVAAPAALPAAGGPPPVGSAFYLVEHDPRLCPSPLCGGYWVSLANRTATRCADGTVQPHCYAARAEAATGAQVTLPAHALVRGRLDLGRDDLGLLVVARHFEPVGKTKSSGRYFRLTDTGIRCVRAPCFSTHASLLNGSSHTMLSGLAIAGTVPESLVAQVERALASRKPLFARGRIRGTTKGGRELHATRFYLRSQR